MIPVAIFGAILFVGIVHLISKQVGGTESFENQFGLFSFAYPLCFIIMHIVKTIYFIVLRTHESS